MTTTPAAPRAPLRAVRVALALASLAGGAAAQSSMSREEGRTYTPPPPSASSTGGAPVDAAALAPMDRAPRLRGSQLLTRDALHPDEIELVGLEGSETPYRADLGLDRTPLAANGDVDLEELHRRQLAIFSGERVKRLPDNVPAPKRTEATVAAAAAQDSARARSYLLPALVALVVVGGLCIEIRRHSQR